MKPIYIILFFLILVKTQEDKKTESEAVASAGKSEDNETLPLPFERTTKAPVKVQDIGSSGSFWDRNFMNGTCDFCTRENAQIIRNITADWSFWSWSSEKLTWEGNKIECIVVENQDNTWSGGSATLKTGGAGFHHVNIEFKSMNSRGITFMVYIFTVPCRITYIRDSNQEDYDNWFP